MLTTSRLPANISAINFPLGDNHMLADSNSKNNSMHKHPHANDPGKMKEHMGMLDLLPPSKATHTAVKDGYWFDPATWGGKVPKAGARVHIPKGRTVFYDGMSDESIKIVRVDGNLQFSHDKNTKIVVDTLITGVYSTLQIGTAKNPIQSDKTAQIIIDGSTAIDAAWDPLRISRGVVTHGKVRIYGDAKADFVKLAQDAKAGDNELILKEAPTGWRVGDRLVLGGTSYNENGSNADNSKYRDEVLKVTEINGNRIKFINEDTNKSVLRFDHTRPEGYENKFNLYLANTTRNIVFKTANADNVPTQQRGHTMFMHNPNVIVKNAGFYNLGRSDKSELVDDTSTNIDGRPGKGTNPRGRYPLHFHRTGVDDINSTPSIAEGNAVVGSPGWGITHHDSHANLKDNVVFDVVGSGIVSESGQERGVWDGNITIKTTGAEDAGAKWNLLRYGPNVPRSDNFDLGVNGEGFWLQGAGK